LVKQNIGKSFTTRAKAYIFNGLMISFVILKDSFALFKEKMVRRGKPKKKAQKVLSEKPSSI